MRSHRGGLILTLGILGFVLCSIFTAIPAWIMGSGDLKAMDAGQMDPEGRALTQAGKICGIIATILNLAAFGVLLVLGMIGGLAGVLSSQ